MPGLLLNKVTKSFGGVKLFDDFDFACEQGQMVVLVGPSGCGKSTLLRMIAGLEPFDSGHIEIAGRDVTGLAPADRGVAMVFQSYALYPQMSVAENIGFPLRMSGLPKNAVVEQIAETAKMLGLSDHLDSRPAQLSGGQRQRVAIGRAIVRKPDIFLFDEPLSNLDAGLRASMRREFARLHQELPATMIYVTHDQAEAMSLADQIVLLRDGRIEQAGSPREIYEQPATRFAAEFFGQPKINWFHGLVAADNTEAPVTLHENRDASVTQFSENPANVWVGIRPENLTVSSGGKSDVTISGDVRQIEWFGGDCHIHCDGPLGAFVWRTKGERDVKQGDRVRLGCKTAELLIYDQAGNAVR